MKYNWLRPIAEDVIKRQARIFGPQSAAQQCLDEAERMRAEGSMVGFFEARQPGQRDGYLVVHRIDERFAAPRDDATHKEG